MLKEKQSDYPLTTPSISDAMKLTRRVTKPLKSTSVLERFETSLPNGYANTEVSKPTSEPMPDPDTLMKIKIIGNLYYFQESTKKCWTSDTQQYFGIWNPVTKSQEILCEEQDVEKNKSLLGDVIGGNGDNEKEV